MKILKFSKLLTDKRGECGVREFSKRIGISAATLSRIERGKLPDLETFTKLCAYLELDPAEVLDIEPKQAVAPRQKLAVQAPAVHFKADAQMDIEAAKDFAELILAAQAFAQSRG